MTLRVDKMTPAVECAWSEGFFGTGEHIALRWWQMSDLERARVDVLLRRARGGIATDAEKEELLLHGVEVPEVVGVDTKVQQTAEDLNWMRRSEADERMIAVESTALVRTERTTGIGLLVGGTLGTFVFPLAIYAAMAGAGLLVWSVLRVKLLTLGRDPYEDIER
ncbi:MAG: hypothetical protein AAF449_12755 [Myxococcota bacterium]